MPDGDEMLEGAERDHAGVSAGVSPWDGVWLLARVADRDAHALEQLYRMWGDRLFSMAVHLLGDEGAAAEALQDCFLRVWQKAGEYDGRKAKGFTWVAMILRGICLDMMRKKRRRAKVWGDEGQVAVMEVPAPQGGVEDLLFRDTVKQVKVALEQLSDEEAESVRRALFDAGSVEDQARRWGVPVATAKTRIFRAMEKLRRLLGVRKGGCE